MEEVKTAIDKWARVELEDGEIQGPDIAWEIFKEKGDGYRHKLITKVADKVRLLRVRNPWGDEDEFQGKWCEHSSTWSSIPEETKKSLNLTVADDGEYWLSFDEFITHFDVIRLVYPTPDTLEPVMCDQNRRFFLDHKKFEWDIEIHKSS